MFRASRESPKHVYGPAKAQLAREGNRTIPIRIPSCGKPPDFLVRPAVIYYPLLVVDPMFLFVVRVLAGAAPLSGARRPVLEVIKHIESIPLLLLSQADIDSLGRQVSGRVKDIGL